MHLSFQARHLQALICLSLCIEAPLCTYPWAAIMQSTHPAHKQSKLYPKTCLFCVFARFFSYFFSFYFLYMSGALHTALAMWIKQHPQHAQPNCRAAVGAAELYTDLHADLHADLHRLACALEVLWEPILFCLHAQIARAFRRKKMMAEVMSGGKGRQEILNKHADRCTSRQCSEYSTCLMHLVTDTAAAMMTCIGQCISCLLPMLSE